MRTTTESVRFIIKAQNAPTHKISLRDDAPWYLVQSATADEDMPLSINATVNNKTQTQSNFFGVLSVFLEKFTLRRTIITTKNVKPT
jgi:hypothetical protein